MKANDLLGTAGAQHPARIADENWDATAALSGVSWSAIAAGAAAAAALSLVLLMLGVGLGLSSVSPWSGHGISAGPLGASAIAWLTFTQLAASGLGGYLAGRLRTRWTRTHVDEVYFRDTAHGFLAWAIATLVTAALLGSAVAAVTGKAADVGASLTAATAVAGAGVASDAAISTGSTGKSSAMADSAYDVDRLFRGDAAPATAPPVKGAAAPSADPAAAGAGRAQLAAEVGRIFAHGRAAGALPADDQAYLAQLVAQRTGLSQPDAEKRVSDGFRQLQARVLEAESAARMAADKARRASTYATLWMFIALLIGAFVASLSATYGGRRRDLA